MAKASLLITTELLVHILKLPEGTHIEPDRICVLVDHRDIPAGSSLVQPRFHREPGNEDKVVFDEWGAL
jgi:hypothetical protein